MSEVFAFEFMQNAFYAAILASVACGIIGSFVVVKRIVFIGGAIAHAAFGGIGIGYFLGVNPLVAVLPFSLLSALGIGFLSRQENLSEDTTIGMFWSAGMALGIILIGLTPGYAPELFGYLFGNILTVPYEDIRLMLFLDAVIILVVVTFYKQFVAISFDEEFAKASGVKVYPLYLLLLVLVALTVVVLVQIVGVILIIALLTIPAIIAKQHCGNSFRSMMVLSVFIGMFLTSGGLFLSYFLDIASGATIILFSVICFAFSSIFRRLLLIVRKRSFC